MSIKVSAPDKKIPKVILHEHIEGSVTAKLAQRLADRHGIKLADNFIYPAEQLDPQAYPNGRYAYDESDFSAFIHTYDVISSLIQTPEDYYLVVSDFLSRNAAQGLLYCELITSPYHMCSVKGSAQAMALDASRYHRLMDEIERAIADAKCQYGLETALHAVGVRHLGAENMLAVAQFLQANPRQSVKGFNIAGDERAGNFADFDAVHHLIDQLPLAKSYHAGEICSAQSVKAALKAGATRIGHGIRAIEDPQLLQLLIEKRITLEISLSSNRILVNTLAGKLANHPLRSLYDSGVRICLNTDDAGIFATDIGREYAIAAQHFAFNRLELLDITLCALEAAFIDRQIRKNLVNRVYSEFTPQDIAELEQLIPQARSVALADRLSLRRAHLLLLARSTG